MFWKTKSSILTGNPEISKSWFQWYVMYRIFKGIDRGPNYAGHGCPTVVVRHEEKLLTFYFPGHNEAFSSDCFFLLSHLNPTVTLYLYEPGACLEGPHFFGNNFQIMMTCSPDSRHYKEFRKKRRSYVLHAYLETRRTIAGWQVL